MNRPTRRASQRRETTLLFSDVPGPAWLRSTLSGNYSRPQVLESTMNELKKEAVMGIKQALLELQSYALWRPIDDETGKSVDALVGAGALSHESADFIRDHSVKFYGYNTNRIGVAIPVLKMGLATDSPPCCIVGCSDGTVRTKHYEA